VSYPIVERLKAWSPMIASGYEVPAASGAMGEAATLIEELAAALEPFAAVVDCRLIPDAHPMRFKSDAITPSLVEGDLRRARAALAKLRGETNAD